MLNISIFLKLRLMNQTSECLIDRGLLRHSLRGGKRQDTGIISEVSFVDVSVVQFVHSYAIHV